MNQQLRIRVCIYTGERGRQGRIIIKAIVVLVRRKENMVVCREENCASGHRNGNCKDTREHPGAADVRLFYAAYDHYLPSESIIERIKLHIRLLSIRLGEEIYLHPILPILVKIT